MNDNEFLTAFEQHTLAEFPHRSHIRMAWLYLRANDWETGQMRIRDGIQSFAGALGASRKYHETITLFWARIVKHAIDHAPEISDFNTFVEKFPFLLDSKAIAAHYSSTLIGSENARKVWCEPDLSILP
jgi:hypothetical protein